MNDVEAHQGGVLWPDLFTPISTTRELKIGCNLQLSLVNLIARYLRAPPGVSPSTHISQNTVPDLSGPLFTFSDAMIAARRPDLSAPSQTRLLLETINNALTDRYAAEVASPDEPRYVERCIIVDCKAPVLWQGLDVAECANGHAHQRCALTALALMSPYVVKRCERCTRPYLDQRALHLFYEDAKACGMVSEEQIAASVDTPDEDGIAWMLREAALCVYCGGKFVRVLPLPESST